MAGALTPNLKMEDGFHLNVLHNRKAEDIVQNPTHVWTFNREQLPWSDEYSFSWFSFKCVAQLKGIYFIIDTDWTCNTRIHLESFQHYCLKSTKLSNQIEKTRPSQFFVSELYLIREGCACDMEMNPKGHVTPIPAITFYTWYTWNTGCVCIWWKTMESVALVHLLLAC